MADGTYEATVPSLELEKLLTQVEIVERAAPPGYGCVSHDPSFGFIDLSPLLSINECMSNMSASPLQALYQFVLGLVDNARWKQTTL